MRPVPGLPQPPPGLGAYPGLAGQEVMHGVSTAGEHRRQGAALGFIQAVGVGEDPQPGAHCRTWPGRPC